jgi:hypothetical protein
MPYYKHLLFIIQHFLLSVHIPIIVDDLKDDVVKFTREIVRIQSYTMKLLKQLRDDGFRPKGSLIF